MSWRPPPQIRVKVLGLPQLGGRILAVEVRDDAGRLKGVRPLGGSVEFGETREAALHREFAEELDTRIAITGPWEAIENLFEHEGATGHEIVFVAPIRLEGRRFDLDAPVHFQDGAPCTARWFAVDELRRGAPVLFPTGLADRLDAMLRV